MDSKINTAKKKSLLIMIFSIVSVFIVGAFAWLSWRSQNTAMVLTIGEIDGLFVTLKPYQISTSLIPSNTYTNQEYVSVTATNKRNGSSSFSLFYRITSIDTALINDEFKYTVVKSTDNWATQSMVKTGDFSSAISGSDLVVYEDSVPGNNTTYQYKVYLWIDNQNSNQAEMQNKVFTGELRADSSSCYEPPTKPTLDPGMIPVTIANDGTVTAVSEDNPDWYRYCDKKWANAVLVKESGVKTRTANKNDLTTIDRSDILAYYVWIPRYSYAMPTTQKTCSDITNLNPTDHPYCFTYGEYSCTEIYNVNQTDYPDCYGYGYQLTAEGREYLIGVYSYMIAQQQGISLEAARPYAVSELDNFTSSSSPILLIAVAENNGVDWLDTNNMNKLKAVANSAYGISPANMESIYNSAVENYEEDTLTQLVSSIHQYNDSVENADEKINPTFDFEQSDEIQLLPRGTSGFGVFGYVLLSNQGTTVNIGSPINIKFEGVTSSKSIGTAIGTNYYTHPAFTFGNQELSGIWVGKFETTGDATTPTVLDNVSSLRNQNVSTQFTTALKFAGGTLSGSTVTFANNNTYGITSSDAHMMKNREWGAAAYLSHSKYGINTKVRINNDSNYTTGCGAYTENSYAGSCEIPYGSSLSYPQSTTGNISGIFDMSGGTYEYVMGNYGNTTIDSGFSTMPGAKYYDLYTIQSVNSCTLATCGGHALDETAGWYSNYAFFVNSNNSWFTRGGYHNDDYSSGVFNFGAQSGYPYDFYSFRSVLVAK